MYFISVGDCAVNILDHKNVDHVATKLLVEGDHFGEISLLYGCNAQASIVSLSYDNLAMLPKRAFMDMCDKFSFFGEVVRKYNYKYSEKRKQFMIRLIKTVEYFEQEDKEIIHTLIYTLKP
jgi:CRP-like cAMP-binding protein